jgi:hypothetical protein
MVRGQDGPAGSQGMRPGPAVQGHIPSKVKPLELIGWNSAADLKTRHAFGEPGVD